MVRGVRFKHGEEQASYILSAEECNNCMFKRHSKGKLNLSCLLEEVEISHTELEIKVLASLEQNA